MATAQEAGEPGEPSIVLPTYILEIEDLSTENVEAGLPDEEALLPPERTPPLPTGGELVIEEADLEIIAPDAGTAVLPAADTSFVIESVLGAGSRHHLYSQFSLYQLGGDPRYQVLFEHQVFDGFGGNPAGAGYDRRSDLLKGSIHTSPGRLTVSASGAFTDTEVGLQGQSIYASRSLRVIEAGAGVEYPITDWLGLRGALQAHSASLFLTRADPDWLTEYVAEPTVTATASTGPLSASLSLAYGIWGAANTGVPVTHRTRVKLGADLDLPAGLRASAEVAWHQEFDGSHHVPFSVVLSGNPWESVRIHLAAGYRLRNPSMLEALQEFGFTASPTAGLAAESGWFGDAGVQVTLARVVVLSVDVAMQLGTTMVTPSADVDPTHGLYTLSQVPADRLDGAATLRWNITPSIYTGLAYRRCFLDRPEHAARDTIEAEFVGAGMDDRVGGKVVGSFSLGDRATPQVPVLDAEAFLRLTENVRVVAEVKDLLAPISQGIRYGVGSYIEPGIQASVKVHLSF